MYNNNQLLGVDLHLIMYLLQPMIDIMLVFGTKFSPFRFQYWQATNCIVLKNRLCCSIISPSCAGVSTKVRQPDCMTMGDASTLKLTNTEMLL